MGPYSAILKQPEVHTSEAQGPDSTLSQIHVPQGHELNQGMVPLF